MHHEEKNKLELKAQSLKGALMILIFLTAYSLNTYSLLAYQLMFLSFFAV
jgi:hypothetical protein